MKKHSTTGLAWKCRRACRAPATQLFVGVYRADGTVLCERAYTQRAGESMSRALEWGDMPGVWRLKGHRAAPSWRAIDGVDHGTVPPGEGPRQGNGDLPWRLHCSNGVLWSAMMIHLGCAGWSLSRQYADEFLQPGSHSHLQRYAARLGAVEINNSFYRPHLPATYARWACSVPEHFRFSVKLPRIITHELRLEGYECALDAFLGQCRQLGDGLGCLLVQLPPSLAHDASRDRRFFEVLRQRHAGPVAVEPRHASWQAAQSMLIDLRIAQVAASPSRFAADAQPAGWPGLAY